VKIILGTNVFMSGLFFSGPPYQILKAWCNGKVESVISQEILEEYQRVALKVGKRLPSAYMDGGASQAFDFVYVAGDRFPVYILFGPAWRAPVKAMGAR
jgi:hypothetical protein